MSFLEVTTLAYRKQKKNKDSYTTQLLLRTLTHLCYVLMCLHIPGSVKFTLKGNVIGLAIGQSVKSNRGLSEPI